MRIWLITLPLIIFVIGGWYLTYQNLEAQINHYVQSIETLKDTIHNEAWEKASESFMTIEEDWKKSRTTWTLLLDHHIIDTIDLSLARTGEYIHSEEDTLSLGELQVLIELFRIIKDNEALTLTNLF